MYPYRVCTYRQPENTSAGLVIGVLTHVIDRIYPAIRASKLLSSQGGSTGFKTLCMPDEGESRGSSPRFNIFFFF